MEKFGRYQLIRQIGAGGMGQVYLARHKGPVGFEKKLVLKRILPHLAEEEDFIDMFFDEARIAAALNHPNIAQIYDLGDVDGRYFLAMEYVAGESIRAVAERAIDRLTGGMPVGLKCRVLADAAAGLDFAHHAKSASGKRLNLIHRDVSPHNILVGFNGAVKLIDFGVAKAQGKVSQTLTGSIKGKYAYMSPEQARGDDLDARSDIFGLGIVLHEILTGERLFKRESDVHTLQAVENAPVPRPSEWPGIPKALDAIVLKALERNRERRYATASEFQDALERFIVDNRLPATGGQLAAFMRQLYVDDLDENGELKPQATTSKGRSRKSGSAGSKRRKTNSRTEVPLFQDERALSARLDRVARTDRVAGVFFTAIVGAVRHRAGAHSQGAGAAYSPDAAYPTTEFLPLLWKAGQLIAPMCPMPDDAFFQLGRECFLRLLASTQGKVLGKLKGAMPLKVLEALLATMDACVRPGDRGVRASTAVAVLNLMGEVLPPQFLVGLIDACGRQCSRLPWTVEVTRQTREAVQLRVRWKEPSA